MTVKAEERYFIFEEDDYKKCLEGRFWNCGKSCIAIVAIITKSIDWAAYIGSSDLSFEREILKYVAEHGCKLSASDARHFFPDIDLPYRY